MKPILTRSEITDAVYIVTKYKVLKDGLVDTVEKYDVTNQFKAMTEPLRADNAKLRELVRDMYGYASNREIELCNECARADDGDCGACGEYDGACGIAKQRFEELYSDRVRELGIEVE